MEFMEKKSNKGVILNGGNCHGIREIQKKRWPSLTVTGKEESFTD